MKQTDIELVRRFQSGDTEAYGELYDRYIRQVYDFVYYKTHHRETAEDLVSRIFMKAMEHISSFDSALKDSSFRRWLYRIAANTVIDHYRVSRQVVDINDVWDLSDDSDIERDADIREKIRQVKEYLGKLNTEQRDVVVMRIWQGMSHREIAEVLNKSEEGCRVMFHRAITKLRKEIAMLVLLLFTLI